MKRNLLTFIFLLGFLSSSIAQPRGKKREPNPDLAKDNFSLQNYRAALDEYILLVNQDPTNAQYNYRLAYCYLNTTVDKAKAISYLEFVTSLPNCDEIAWFDLARAYQYGYQFDKAITTFKKYKSMIKSNDILEDIDHQIENCYTAKEKMKYPLNITFENLGKDVNTEFPDFNPFINSEENFLVFTTKRKGTMGGYAGFDGYPTADIFCAEEKSGKWTKAKTLGNKVNSEGSDEATSVTPDGEYLFVYTENDVYGGDIWASRKKGKAYQQKAMLDDNINKNSIEIGASIYQEGDVIFFNSNKSGGLGGFDLYMARKLPTGQFAEPMNLGPNVNTKYDEDYPVISADGTTLYFASKGHSNMGGYDIFKSVWNAEERAFGPAVNLGYPINTPDDNMTISFTSNGRNAYVSASREGGIGDLDLYRITFSSVEPSYTALRGMVKTIVKADYNESKEFFYYSKNNRVFEFPEEYKPHNDPSWTFIESKKMTVKEGFEYRSAAIYAKTSDDPKALSIKFIDGSTQFIKEMTNTLVKKANYLPPAPGSRPEFMPKGVTNATISVFAKETGVPIGEYAPSPSTGRYIIIVSPGKYTIKVEASGFKPFSTEIEVLDMGSFREELDLDLVLQPLQP